MNHGLSYWEKEELLGKADFLIIGSGIVGLSAAIQLKKYAPKKRVLIIERGILPSGASTKNAGFACIGSSSEILSDIQRSNISQVFKTVEKRWQGLLNLRELLGDEAIGYHEYGSFELFRQQDQREFEKSRDHLEMLNKHVQGITGIKNNYTIHNDIIPQAGFSGFTHAISNLAEGQINTGKMMNQLLQKARSLGIEILTACELKSFDLTTAFTSIGPIQYEKLVFCTNGFSKKFFPELDVTPARAQVLITKPIQNLKWKGIFHFDQGYYYFRNINHRILFGGGRNIDPQGETTEEMITTKAIMDRLQSILEENILPNQSVKIESKWAGIMGVGQSKHPIVRQVDENIYSAVRLGGMGVAIGTLIGKEIAELILQV